MWADLADLANRACRDTFGVVATLTLGGNPPEAVQAIFDRRHEALSTDGELAFSTTVPALDVRLADLSQVPAQDDLVTVDGEDWIVTDVQPDGAGMATLILTRV
jgi:hypothetical protein